MSVAKVKARESGEQHMRKPCGRKEHTSKPKVSKLECGKLQTLNITEQGRMEAECETWVGSEHREPCRAL